MPLHSSLGNNSETPSQKKKKKFQGTFDEYLNFLKQSYASVNVSFMNRKDGTLKSAEL